MILAVALSMASYSASVLDLETVGCFLVDHDMTLDPKNKTKPQVDFLSSEHPAQSASEKALTRVDLDFLMSRPMSSVCLRYLRMRLTEVQ
jgi:hypothetical protein